MNAQTDAARDIEQALEDGAVMSAKSQMVDDLILDFGLLAVVDAVLEISKSRKVQN